MAPLVRSLADRCETCYVFHRVLRGLSTDGGWSMATAEYYRKQIELLLVSAMATADPDLKAKLLARALEFLALVDRV